MKIENIATLKGLAVIAAIATALGLGLKGCSKWLDEQVNIPQIDPELKNGQRMTLIDKQQCQNDSILYFDTDGNTNTTEVVALNHSCCLGQSVKIHDAPIGKTQSFEKWQKDLFCEPCAKKIRWYIQKVGQKTL